MTHFYISDFNEGTLCEKNICHIVLFFFLISCLLIPLIYLYVTLNINAAKNTSLSVSSVSAAQKQDTTTPSDTSGAPSDNTDRQDIPDTEIPMTEMTTVDADYFDDALMIGDSRTVGLKEYGTLGNATFYCDSGLSIYELENKKLWWTVSERSVSLIF